MFTPPDLPETLVYFGPTRDLARLHAGESFGTRLEREIRIHQGQIRAENLLLNTVAKYQHIADTHDIPRDELNAILREHRYHLEDTKTALMARHAIPEEAFSHPLSFEPVDTADFMRQRAAMIGAVLSSTPVMLRDPWGGRPVTAQYGFSDFKAEVDGIGFSAVATPRFKGIRFRFAVMKHEHDGYTDNNPAFIMSDEFCDAFALYNEERHGGRPDCENPLLIAMATNLKPNIHDRFHNWLLYDINAASETFKQWGDDIYFVEHADKNPLLINYEYVALCFHLYGYQMMFDKNPGFKDQMYDRLEDCVREIQAFGSFLQDKNHPQAIALEESTLYAVFSNICFVLNPFEPRFQALLAPYADIRDKLLEVRADGKGIGGTLQRLHGYEDSVPSQKFGGAREAVIEYILRYPLAEEIREKLNAERRASTPDDFQPHDGFATGTIALGNYHTLPPALRDHVCAARDPQVFAKIDRALQSLPPAIREVFAARTEISDEGYFFFRLGRDELDYTGFDARDQVKKLLLVDIPAGQDVNFTNEKKLAIGSRVKKQDFHLTGGRDVLAINVHDEAVALDILNQAQLSGTVDPDTAIAQARKFSALTGADSVGDLYKIERSVAARLYDFKSSGFHTAVIQKHLAQAPGPVVMQLHSGGDQRLVKGAFVYLPLGKDPARDADPDCHLIENTDYRHDYNTAQGTDNLTPARLKPGTPLAAHPNATALWTGFLQTLHEANFQITHGAASTAKFFRSGPAGPSLFS